MGNRSSSSSGNFSIQHSVTTLLPEDVDTSTETTSFTSSPPEYQQLWANDRSDPPGYVELECNEFTSLCPVTKQPDFGKVTIYYDPSDKIIETVSAIISIRYPPPPKGWVDLPKYFMISGICPNLKKLKK